MNGVNQRESRVLLGLVLLINEMLTMKKKTRKPYNNMLNAELMKKLKILAAKQDKRNNDLLEEAIQDLLRKYKKKFTKKSR